MRQPLFLPPPVIVGSGLLVCKVEIDTIFSAEATGNSMGNAAGRVGEFPEVEKHILRIVTPDSVQHGRVKRIQPQDPVKLVGGKDL